MKRIIALIFIVITILGYSYLHEHLWDFLPWTGTTKEAIILIQMTIAVFGVMFIALTTKHSDQAKITWIIVVAFFQIFGLAAYLWIGSGYGAKKKLSQAIAQDFKYIDKEVIQAKPWLDSNTFVNVETHLVRNANRGIYNNGGCKFLEDGREFKKLLLADLNEAKTYIHMEYFIWEDSKFADEVKKVLISKSKKGVEVRVLVDGLPVRSKLNKNYIKELKAAGINFAIFDKLKTKFSVKTNYRDHRKITVIDGKVGYTGGFNIGDEYTHDNKKFGYWGDTGIRLTGGVVRSLQLIFLENWTLTTKELLEDNKYFTFPKGKKSKGYVQIVEDGPNSQETILSETIVGIIAAAKQTVWLSTPYLIPTTELLSALKLAARQGKDVRILTPGLADKNIVFDVTRSYYKELKEAGVQIYEFHHKNAPRFMHAKMVYADGEIATIGSCNLDLRSFRLNFEIMAVLYETKTVVEIGKYFEKMFATSEMVIPKYIKKHNIYGNKISTAMLRLFEPLM